MLTGEVNRHIFHYWSDWNSYLVMETHSPTPQFGFISKHIVGPLLIECIVNRNICLNLLQECVDPVNTEILENEDNLLENEIMF